MRREALAILLLAALSGAAFDQSYVHTIATDGSSTIVKTFDISVLSDQLQEGGLGRMAALCQQGFTVSCSVDTANKRITMYEKFYPNTGYYTLATEYNFPYITRTLEIDMVPNDVFGADMDELLAAANATSAPSTVSAPINLKGNNNETAGYLKMLKASMTYKVVMPSQIAGVSGKGVVNGAAVTFDLVDAMTASKPLVVKTSELNLEALVAIGAVVAIGGLALLFFGARKRK